MDRLSAALSAHRMMIQLMRRFIIVSLLPVAVIVVPAYNTAKEQLTQQVQEKLTAKASSRKTIMHNYLQTMARRGDLRAGHIAVAESVKALADFSHATETTDPGHVAVDSPGYEAVYAQVKKNMLRVAQEGEYADVYVVSAPDGHVQFSYRRDADLGTNLTDGPYKGSGMADAFKRAVATRQTCFSDYAWHEPAKAPALFVASPVKTMDDKVIAVTLVRLDNKVIAENLSDRTGLGESGEIYVIGADLLMRSDSRFTKESTILKRKVDTDAGRMVQAGKSGLVEALDYRGVPVMSYVTPLAIKELTGFEWGLLIEVDLAEIYMPIHDLRMRLIIECLVGVLVICLSAWLLARNLTRPLNMISDAVRKVAEGDLTVVVNADDRKDEVTRIATGFQAMTSRLREQTAAIAGNTATIGAATAQITSAMAELASSVTETASAVAETSATTEEVKQTALLASQKAQLVAEGSRRAVDVAADSQNATDKTVAELTRLQEQIGGVASRMYRLSEQTRSIGAVITTVNDIFDQANLLAVNAAIEAAKAGEHGRGFGVVAQEIRGLADRSRKATTEIPVILGEIERAASAAVAATEQGTRTIESVMAQSVAAGHIVRDLSGMLGEAAQAASQILVSGQQQVIGMNQVASAMESIRIASAQNADSARSAQETTRTLDGVGKDLRGIVEWYKV